MRIAIIGAGSVGGTLGQRWMDKGHSVKFGVRRPRSTDYDALRAAGASFATAGGAIDGADIVVLAVPWQAVEAVASECRGFAGHDVIDCSNPLESADDRLWLAVEGGRSGAEQLADDCPDARIYKTLNHTGAENMADPVIDGRPLVMYVAGDGEGKPRVLELVAELGFEARDAGGLHAARLLEALAMLWIHEAVNLGAGRDFGFTRLQRG